MSRVDDTGHVKGRLRPLEKIRARGFRVLSTMEDLFTCGKLCPFLTLVRGPFWPRFFTKLNCVVPVGLSFLSFLIKAVTLFFLIGRLFKCPSWLCPRQGVAYFTSVCM